jgi:formylglycine-generating enzyme required for sulfatase activity
MRSDFFDRLETMPALASLSEGEGRFLLLPPDAAEVGQIIRQPAREAGLRFEVDSARGRGLDDIIRQATMHETGALPLLSFLLDQLWQRRSETGLLTFVAYEELGGLEGAIGRRAEEVFLAQPEAVRNELVSVLRALVTVKGGKATSRSAPLSMFSAGSPRRALVDAFLHAEARLLVADTDAGVPQLRLAHEALLSHWLRARDQIAADARDLELRGRLEQEAEAWRAASRRHKASLVRAAGLPLAEALALCARWGAELPAEVTQFVIASRLTARRRRVRLVASLTGAVAVLPLIAGLAWLAMVWWGVRAVEAEIAFVAIPPGCFEMGSPDTDKERYGNEWPVPGVCVAAFELGKHEVTQAQWRRVMVHNSDPSVYKGDRNPVDSVSWNEVRFFVRLLNAFGRHHYRLPSEAEWEYAARAGTKTARYWGPRAEDGCDYENMADLSMKKRYVAVTADCDDGHIEVAPVGSKLPNPFGLHDMLGNVEEWVEDCYVADRRGARKDGRAVTEGDCSSRAIRGGSWNSNPRYLRAAYRSVDGPVIRSYYLGFRLARTIPP